MKVRDWVSGSMLFLCLLWVYQPPEAHAARKGKDWQVRRTDRTPIMIRRLKGMLARKPLSRYAFRRLLSVHRSGRARARLTAYYRQQVRRQPKAIAPRLILARLLVVQRRYASALALFQAVRKQRPKMLFLKLREARCLLGLGRKREALARFRSVLPHIKRSAQKKRLLRQMLRTALAARDEASIRFSLQQIRGQTWGRSQRILLGRLLERHRRPKAGLKQFLLALKGSRGGAKVRLLMDIIRLQIQLKQYQKALKRLQEARKIGTVYRWLSWELQIKEIDLYRRMKQLPLLVARLDRKWRKSRSYQKTILLARLYEELKVHGEALRFYNKALKLKPSAREPRMRLIKWYVKKKDPQKVRFHTEKLIKHKQATPRHYFGLIRVYLKHSRRPRVARWNPSWPKIYRRYCAMRRYKRKRPRGSRARRRYLRNLWLYRRRHRYRYRHHRHYYARNPTTRYRCSKKSWEAYRRKRWRFWQKHESDRSRRSSYTKAIRFMRQLMRQYPRDWDSLYELEGMFARYGSLANARQAVSKLLRSTGAQLHRIRQMEQLLTQLGRQREIKGLLRKALRTRWMMPKPATALAAYAYAPSAQARYRRPTKKDRKIAIPYKQWARSICPNIRSFLRRVARRIPSSFAQRDPDVALRMGALMWRCGERGKRLQKMLRSLEQLATAQPKTLRKLLRTYIQFQATAPFHRLVSHPMFGHDQRALVQQLSQLLTERTPQVQVQFVLKYLQKYLHKKPRVLGGFLMALCDRRALCLKTKPMLKHLVHHSSTPPSVLFLLLERTMRHGIFHIPRQRWLEHLVKWRYKKQIRALHMLAERDGLFRYPHTLRGLHWRLVLRVLKARAFAPANISQWGQMLAYHLDHMYPSRHKKQIQELLTTARRFPSLYRQVLSFLLQNSRYKNNLGPQMLKAWLQTHNRLPDLQLLEYAPQHRYYAHHRQRWLALQSSWLLPLVQKIQTPESLGWLMAYAHRHEQPKLLLASLRRLHQLRPRDLPLLRQLAMTLESFPKKSAEANRYWKMWFKRKDGLVSQKGILRFMRSCCADRASERMAFRLLQEGYRRHGNSASGRRLLWQAVQLSLTRLRGSSQKQLMGWLSSQPGLSFAQKRELARAARRKKHFAQAISLTQALLKGPGNKKPIHKDLAQMLDKARRFQEASGHWQRYLSLSRKNARSFYRQRAAAAQGKKQRLLARVFLWRALPSATRAQVLRYEVEGKHDLAWAAWLRMQDAAQQKLCLQHANGALKTQSPMALRLWRLGVSYSGPLLFFSRCQWSLTPRARYTLVPTLLAYLKKHTSHGLTIVGSADPNGEPDVDFLAQRRAHALRRLLLSGGIAASRLRVSHFQGAGLCRLQTRSPLSCRKYRRQVIIATHESGQSPTLTSIIIPLQAYLKTDADRDRTPDYLDQCPLQHSRQYNPSTRYRRRYRYRRRRRSYRRRYRYRYRRYYYRGRYRYRRYRVYNRYRRKYRLYRPWAALPQRKQKKGKKKRQNLLPGCPESPFLAIKKVDKGQIHLGQQILFSSSYSSYLNSRRRGGLYQVAALLRAAPQLGTLQIELNPLKDRPVVVPRSRRYYRYGRLYLRYRYRYRYRYRRRRTSPSLLAFRRAQALVRYLTGRGVPKSRLSTKIKLPISRARARAGKSRYSYIRLLLLKPGSNTP